MMKKNGFIATSLIYSFFLIFITLFLTIIADYLQNKVLLNTIEKGIKDEINSSMGIRDFEVGDMIGFLSNCDEINDPTGLNSAPLFVIANVVINNTTKCNGDNNCLILYGVKLSDTGYTQNVDYDAIQNDIDFGYRNNTYYNKIIYNFDTEEGTKLNYNLGISYTVYKNDTNCSSAGIVDFKTDNNCIKEGSSSSYYRERLILKESESTNGRFQNCGSSSGTSYIKK